MERSKTEIIEVDRCLIETLSGKPIHEMDMKDFADVCNHFGARAILVGKIVYAPSDTKQFVIGTPLPGDPLDKHWSLEQLKKRRKEHDAHWTEVKRKLTNWFNETFKKHE